METKTIDKKRILTIPFLFALVAGGLILLAVFTVGSHTENYPEIQELSNKKEQISFIELTTYLQELAQKKGGVYAYEVLKRAQLPSNTDLHLLGHIVGDQLYIQEGVSGMSLCTHDFRNACSHSVVIGAMVEFGEGVLPEIHEACKNAPGGKGAYTMCFHGFGHGVLAYNGFDLPSTVAFCNKTRTSEYGNRESAECVGGAMMEILGGGESDRESWLERRAEYFNADDPLVTCNASYMSDEVSPTCFNYLTPYLFEAAGADLRLPTPKDFERAFLYCDAVSKEQVDDRRACFGGFGKEFVVLAQDRDIRKIDEMTDAQLARVYEWCQLSPHREGTNACIQDAVQSLYWGGENDRGAAVNFCSNINDSEFQETCVTELTEAVGQYIDSLTYKKDYCTELPTAYQNMCQERIL